MPNETKGGKYVGWIDAHKSTQPTESVYITSLERARSSATELQKMLKKSKAQNMAMLC